MEMGLLDIIKIGGSTAWAVSTWAVWRGLPKPMVRRQLRNVFKLGKIGIEKKSKGEKKRSQWTYPTIKSISISPDVMQAIFVLPKGVEPKTIHDKEWLFRQEFGDQIEINEVHTAKVFQLKVFEEKVQQFPYVLETIQKEIKNVTLPIVVGKSRNGWEVYDMIEHPHLLIAGETGSGKSTQLRSILTTLLLTLSPFQLRLYLADLKRSEFHLFKRAADQVVIDAVSLKRMLMKIQRELTRRGDLLDAAEQANIMDLPEKDRPPFIILCIDEVALLKKEKDCMQIIEEISAIGRALGVFLILSMQRPDAQILDGKLKNNLTVRMAFKHSDEVNSRITLDSGEAAKINGTERGRMAYKGVHAGIRSVQGPYLDLGKAKGMLANEKSVTNLNETSTTGGSSSTEISLPAERPNREDVLPELENKNRIHKRDSETNGPRQNSESGSENEDVSIFDLPTGSEKRWKNDKRFEV